MSACMIVATDEKGRPLGQALATSIFVEKGLMIQPSMPLKIEADGPWAHMEIRCVSAGDRPGSLVWTHDLDRIVPVRTGQTIHLLRWVSRIEVKDEVKYV